MKLLHQKIHISLTPDVFLWVNKTLTGQNRAKYRAAQGKNIFTGQSWFDPRCFTMIHEKCHFSQTIVFLRVNFKIGAILQGKVEKNFCKHKIVFLSFCKLQLKWMCFCHFWKCGHFSLTDTRCFIMPNCMKNHIFVNLCGGVHRCTFKLASMYYMRLFLIYTHFISKSIRKKIKDLIFIIKKY